MPGSSPAPGSKLPGKASVKRPRSSNEDEEYESPYHQTEGAPTSTMVGLVCPKCRQMFRGAAALKAHFPNCSSYDQQVQCEMCDATLQNQRALDAHVKKDHYRPIGQVAPAQRTRGNASKPTGVQNFPKLANNPSLGISKVSRSGPSKPENMPYSARPSRRTSNSSGSSGRQSASSTPSSENQSRVPGKAKGKPNLTEIGHKLGLAVSITSVASNNQQKGGAEQNPQPNAEHIKEEPVEVEENEVVEEVKDDQDYVGDYNQEGDGYEGEMMEDYGEGEMEEGDYGEGEEGYPDYDYEDGQHGQGEGSSCMFKNFRD